MTVYLRQGIKWSDGQPFTAADIMFYWEDVLFEEKSLVTPNANLYVAQGVAPKVEMIDDYTLKFTFPFSYYFAETAFNIQFEWAWPKHFMQKWHPRYNTSATWEEWNERTDWVDHGEVSIQAWMLESWEPGADLVVVRNPYYWKIDPAGNQLPYIDRVRTHGVENRQAVALKAVAGEIDWDCMWVGTQHLSMFLEEKDNRDYDVGYARVSGMAYYFNYSMEDKTARSIVRNLNFRRAFSLALNRKEMGRVMFSDMLFPSSWSFAEESAYYDEKVSKLYTEYDPEKARRLLDEAGFKDRNGDGVRETPGGQDVKLIIDVSQHDLYVPLLEMAVDDLANVGIKAVMNVQLQALISSRYAASAFQVYIWDFYMVDEPLAGLHYWVPLTENLPRWHKDAYLRKMEDDFDRTYAEFTDLMMKAKGLPFEERVATMKKAQKISAENVFGVHIGYYQRPYIVSNRIGNAEKRVARSDVFGGDAPPFRPEQFYIKYEQK